MAYNGEFSECKWESAMSSGLRRQYASRIEGMTSFKVVDFLEAAVKMEAQAAIVVASMSFRSGALRYRLLWWVILM